MFNVGAAVKFSTKNRYVPPKRYRQYPKNLGGQCFAWPTCINDGHHRRKPMP